MLQPGCAPHECRPRGACCGVVSALSCLQSKRQSDLSKHVASAVSAAPLAASARLPIAGCARLCALVRPINNMDAWCSVGMRVEVILTEEGLAGSRYAGRVIEMAKGRALVEFEVRAP